MTPPWFGHSKAGPTLMVGSFLHRHGTLVVYSQACAQLPLYLSSHSFIGSQYTTCFFRRVLTMSTSCAQ